MPSPGRPPKYCLASCKVKHKHKFYVRKPGAVFPAPNVVEPVKVPKPSATREDIEDAAFPSLGEFEAQAAEATRSPKASVQAPPVQSTFNWSVVVLSINPLIPEEYKITPAEADQLANIINSAGIVIDPREGEAVHVSFEVGVVLAIAPFIIPRLKPLMEWLWTVITEKMNPKPPQKCKCGKEIVEDAARPGHGVHKDGTVMCS